MLTDTNGTIIKIDSAKSFLDIREAFCFGEDIVGKILFQFRSYDKSKPKGQKITQKVDFYLTLEDASYFAEMLKTGRIYSLCRAARDKANTDGKSTSFSFGYQKFGGTASKKISKQLKIQQSDDGRLWIKALEGPGIVENKGQIKPAYKDNEASQKIAMTLDEEQAVKIGLSIERAIRYFDIWNASGTLKENIKAIGKQDFKGRDAEELIPVDAYSAPYEDEFSQDIEERF